MKPLLKKIIVTYITPFKTKSIEYLFPFKVKSTDAANDLSRFFDSIAFTEQKFSNIGKSVSDQYSLEEIIGKSFGTIKTDTAIVNDEFHITVDFSRLFSDQTNEITDNIKSKDFGKGLSDSVFFSEILNRLVNYNRRFNDYYSAIDVPYKSSTKTASDQYTLSDYIEFRNNFNRAFLDQTNQPTDEIKHKDFGKGLFDTPIMIDTFNRLVNYVRSKEDIVFPSDLASKNIAKLITDSFNLNDVISISSADQEYEQIQPLDQAYKGFSTTKSDYYNVSDVIANIGINKIVNETLGIADDFYRIVNFTRIFDETISIVDVPSKTLTMGTKSDNQYYQDEDGLVSKDTYIDAQYYQSDFIESVNLYFKTINEAYDQIITTDVLVVVPNKGFLESITTNDNEKSYIINTYIDSSFLSSNYIGSQVTI